MIVKSYQELLKRYRAHELYKRKLSELNIFNGKICGITTGCIIDECEKNPALIIILDDLSLIPLYSYQ